MSGKLLPVQKQLRDSALSQGLLQWLLCLLDWWLLSLHISQHSLLDRQQQVHPDRQQQGPPNRHQQVPPNRELQGPLAPLLLDQIPLRVQ